MKAAYQQRYSRYIAVFSANGSRIFYQFSLDRYKLSVYNIESYYFIAVKILKISRIACQSVVTPIRMDSIIKSTLVDFSDKNVIYIELSN
ncbi:hypothetical protein ELBI_48 [Anabaena phage Elbi]|nr:hypothetical protein ELBI_48 [Anabaena phage Elbi]